MQKILINNDFYKTEYSHSTEETENIGKALAQRLISNPSFPKFIALYGDLGAGKTAFVRGFASAIAPLAKVKSPTFSLVREYSGDKIFVFHFDMYRITDEDDLYSIGFYDYFDRKGFIITEWSENIEFALPSEYIRVKISKRDDENERLIETKLVKTDDKNNPLTNTKLLKREDNI